MAAGRRVFPRVAFRLEEPGPVHQLEHSAIQLREPSLRGRRTRHPNSVSAAADVREVPAQCLPEAPPYAIALHRSPDLLADHHTEANVSRGAWKEMKRDQRVLPPPAAPVKCLKRAGLREPVRPGQHRWSDVKP
jgi:hypothetical protein